MSYPNPRSFMSRSPVGLGSSSIKDGISWTKIFFIVIIIFTIAYISLQIQKGKYEKKYSVALLSLLVISLVHGLLIMKIPEFHLSVKIIKGFITFGVLLSFFVLEILMGQNKF